MEGPNRCSACNNDQTTITDPELGEVICSNCGVVVLEGIEDYTHEERPSYSTEEFENRSRTGAPTSLAIHDRGLSTTIGNVNKDAYGNALDATMLSQIKKLRKWNSWINSHRSSRKNLRRAFQQLDLLKDKLGLTEAMVEKIAYLFRKLHERKLSRGRTVDGMLAASVYTVCREFGTSVTLNDIATASNLTNKDISRCYRLLVFELDINIPTVDPTKCVLKLSNKLGIKENTKKQAMNIMNEIVKKEMSSGKIPMGLAASVLYLSCQISGERISQATIAEASNTTEVTIRNRFKDVIQINSLYSKLCTVRGIP